jgi:hypothetical protein
MDLADCIQAHRNQALPAPPIIFPSHKSRKKTRHGRILMRSWIL